MTALAANRTRHQRNEEAKMSGAIVGVDSDEFYSGGLVSHNGSGKVAPSSDTSGHGIAGVCTERESTGTSNTKKIKFEWGHEEWFPVKGSTIAAANIGTSNAYVSDDNTLTTAADATNDVPVGRLTELETIDGVAGAWVHVGVMHAA